MNTKRELFWVIERYFLKEGKALKGFPIRSLPQYMDHLGCWCECIYHAKRYDTREEAQYELTKYLRHAGAPSIHYQVAEHEITPY